MAIPLKLTALTNPVTFGYTTSPVVANNQTDVAGESPSFGALPLSLLQFTGTTAHAAQVQLQWKTAQEINTKDFEVEWATDGLQYKKITTISAAGNSTVNRQYSYLHTQPTDGNNYYRLKMQDIDGSFTYSPVVKVTIAVETLSVNFFPNPVADFLQMNINAIKSETIVLNLHSADGKIIASKQFPVVKGSNQFTWNFQSVPAGNYFISSSTNQFSSIQVIKK